MLHTIWKGDFISGKGNTLCMVPVQAEIPGRNHSVIFLSPLRARGLSPTTLIVVETWEDPLSL